MYLILVILSTFELTNVNLTLLWVLVVRSARQQMAVYNQPVLPKGRIRRHKAVIIIF